MVDIIQDQDRTDGGEVWGSLHRDSGVLDAALGQASDALERASIAARWTTEQGYPIGSPLADMLGGLATIVDSIIDQREEQKDHQDITVTHPNVIQATADMIKDLRPDLTEDAVKHLVHRGQDAGR